MPGAKENSEKQTVVLGNLRPCVRRGPGERSEEQTWKDGNIKFDYKTKFKAKTILQRQGVEREDFPGRKDMS